MKRIIFILLVSVFCASTVYADEVKSKKQQEKEIARKKKEYQKRIARAQANSKAYFVQMRECNNLAFAKTHDRRTTRKGLKK